ncbi:MAG TPA: dockerin type I domain-containing protein, partial [Chthoniobacterales bacterium]|nr:dockerin type I domain-containing protein [Chthoniobacterales bacterium]
GTVPGPDVIVGDLNGLSQPDTAAAGTQVGISVGTDSCNLGAVDLDWFQTPNSDHPVIPQNLYRMSGGTTNDGRFEQIGQSSVKHAFTALMENICNLGCNNVGGTHLGSGCSDPYVVSLNSGGSTHNLGSRAWINPFTGVFPRGDSATPPNSHTGHTHNSVSHRMLVEINDLNTSLNAGATYYAEAQYITPHEYVWCQGHHGECNMYNNVSYRRYNVTGTTGPFSFATGGFTTVRMQSAINAWTGATINPFEPDPGNDGIGSIGWKVTNPSAGVWHYEYAVYNQNLDRAIQSFSVPLGCGITVSNLGFHAPPQQPGWAADGTVGNAGFSSTPWTSSQTSSALSWNSETFAQNQNANAIRWGTLYNFRFDSNQPPQAANATVGFFKTGGPVTVPIQAPAPSCSALQLTSAVSQKMHNGLGPFSVPLPLTGTPGLECRNSNGDHTIVFTFNNNVVSGNASVTTQTGGSVSGSPVFSGNTATVNLTGVTNAQQITVTLSGTTDNFSQVLPDTSVSMSVLTGDTTADGVVNSADVTQTRRQSGSAADSSNFREDLNLDGAIDSGDITLVRRQSGSSLP